LSSVCIDTSAYSRLMRGDHALRSRIEMADTVLTPVTVLGELHAGFELGTRRQENHEVLRAFLDQPGVSIISTTPNIAERYGRLVKQLRDSGTPIPTNDIWIAAAVLETGSRLLTYDAHFEHVPGVIVESPGQE